MAILGLKWHIGKKEKLKKNKSKKLKKKHAHAYARIIFATFCKMRPFLSFRKLFTFGQCLVFINALFSFTIHKYFLILCDAFRYQKKGNKKRRFFVPPFVV